MPTPNRQPIFVATPVLTIRTFDPPINTNSTNLDTIPPTQIYLATVDEGALIERITISATVDETNTAFTDKFIYLCIYDETVSPSWSLYSTGYLTFPSASKKPELVFNIDGGLVLLKNQKLGLLASTNYATTNQLGDQVAVVVEGGTYNAV
jgi:hypothetical protein